MWPRPDLNWSYYNPNVEGYQATLRGHERVFAIEWITLGYKTSIKFLLDF